MLSEGRFAAAPYPELRSDLSPAGERMGSQIP